MPDTTQTADFDSTIHLLQQDVASADLVVAIALIERWERQLQGTDIFGNLSELKQAILDGNTTEIVKLLRTLSDGSVAMAASVEDESGVAAKIEEIGRLLAQASQGLR